MTERPSFEEFTARPPRSAPKGSSLTREQQEKRTIAIRTANDVFRKTTHGGDVVMTSGIQALGLDSWVEILERTKNFTDFNEDNDPYGEHDFGSFTYNGDKIYWKIDYYDQELTGGSPDPANPTCTRRVMTIMLAEEY